MTDKYFDASIEWMTAAAPHVAKKFAPIYEVLEWKWTGRGLFIPTVKDIERVIKEIINHCVRSRQTHKERDSYWCETGGLIVKIDEEKGCSIGFIFDFHCFEPLHEKRAARDLEKVKLLDDKL